MKLKIKDETSFFLFKVSLLILIRIRFLACLNLGLSFFSEHKFRHNFADCVKPLYSSSIKPETTLHFFLDCHNFLNIRGKLFDKTPEKVDENSKCSNRLHYQFR